MVWDTGTEGHFQAGGQPARRAFALPRIFFFGLAFFIGKKWMKSMMEKKKDDDVEST